MQDSKAIGKETLLSIAGEFSYVRGETIPSLMLGEEGGKVPD